MRPLFTLIARQKSSELFVLAVLLVTLGLAWTTELAGLSLALGAFLARATRAYPDDAEEIAVSVMKLSGRAAYVLRVAGSDEPGGHFNLATSAYAHSTAPNRRYADVAIQRLLHARHRGHAPPLTDEALATIAERCTEMAANAARVERQVAKSAAALFLSDRVGSVFEAVVSGVTARGTWVRLFHPAVEGKLVARADGLDVGEHLTVRLEAADVRRGHLDFSRVTAPSDPSA